MRSWRVVAVGGGLLAAAGSGLQWTTVRIAEFRDQNLSVAGFGGPRQFTLILAALAVIAAAAPLPGAYARGRALVPLGIGGAAVAAMNIVFIGRAEGGGFGKAGGGVWLSVLAFGVVALSGWRHPDFAKEPATWDPRWPAPVEWIIVLALSAAALWAGYDLFLFDEAALFLTLLGGGIAIGIASERTGLVKTLLPLFSRRKSLALALLLAILVVFPLTQATNQYPVRILASVGLFGAAALGLNVVVGAAGLLDLGYIAFFGIGAYIAAIFGGNLSTVSDFHIPFFWIFLMSCSGAGLAGVVLGAPTLRLRGDYLAIVTLGFGEIVRRVMENFNLTHGNVGVADIPDLVIGPFDFGRTHTLPFALRRLPGIGDTLAGFANYYYLEILYMLAIVFIVSRLNRSRIGRAWVAIREDELAASAMGVNTISIKLLAFGVGAFVAGGAGSIFSHLNTNATPDSFSFIESVTVLSMVVLGGMGNLGGVILGALLLVVLPEKLRFFQEQRLLLFGAALILMMRFRPEGIIPSSRRRREFREGEGSAMGPAPGSGATLSAAGSGSV